MRRENFCDEVYKKKKKLTEVHGMKIVFIRILFGSETDEAVDDET